MGCKYRPSVCVQDVYVDTFQVLRGVILVTLMFSRKTREHIHIYTPTLILIDLLRNWPKPKVPRQQSCTLFMQEMLDVYLTCISSPKKKKEAVLRGLSLLINVHRYSTQLYIIIHDFLTKQMKINDYINNNKCKFQFSQHTCLHVLFSKLCTLRSLLFLMSQFVCWNSFNHQRHQMT